MLTGKQKRFLRSKAHHIEPTFQVGKSGVNENMVAQLNDILEKRELIKIHVLQNNFDDKDDLAQTISETTESEIVQVIGSMIVLYKESTENKKIELP
ncbi:RNA-binding protein [Staphylococcus auricularis]|uniref:Ribosome assembly RNA-binding protein YhbY n=1 Tax=Staphylococcus auricularis TaxID=29379 RepID=A0AAP8TSH0_9STAP|nr:ribosome assembly RNA-binding protein YhbY [Staphylococcus auricularis]MBM0868011.1 ribosome assembly RNA-binding protein YhbY [Staphylococcus auricularis]MCG7340990.1 ribosome assembly RNA-binding protein YhbY [Staphylococcus auricularis]MDC6326829.1 ribosome assembly RNA-binding protein YhbY [Staphylococcus auricularis]MDN4532706.1 ribosome assembly RNA-binding protein YhbY [Staphylococcus auricularis]PNZ66095.1 ribosome assembly RNA-binding protein YhbY [Staphylococcus auricularis]